MTDQPDQFESSIGPSFGDRSTAKETPDMLLTNFLRSGEVVASTSDKTPQQNLRDILNDKRWTRRMLENWFKKGPQSKHFSVTPDPEFRAIYLILLSLLEDRGKQNVDHKEDREHNTIGNQTMIEGQQAEEQRKFNERVMEHFDKDSTWEKVD